MPKKRNVKTRKQDAFKEICSKLGIDWSNDFIAGGSTITGLGIQKTLDAVSEMNGIPPSYLKDNEKLIWKLLHKSRESFILSLEIINKITIPYRLEAFVYLFINAWELLLKAKILKDGGSIEDKNDPNYTIGIGVCAKKVFTAKGAYYKNISIIKDLRDKATHYFIDKIPYTMMGILQAGILNYYNSRKNWFDSDITDNIQGGMMYLVVDSDLSKFTIASLKKSLSTKTIEYLTEWESRITSELNELSENDVHKYFNGINISLAFERNPSKAETLQYIGSSGVGVTKVIQIKDADKDYPYTTKKVVEQIKKKGVDITVYFISQVLPFTHKTKENDKFHYKSTMFGNHQYSDSFVDWVVNQTKKDDQFIKDSNEKYRNHKKRETLLKKKNKN